MVGPGHPPKVSGWFVRNICDGTVVGNDLWRNKLNAYASWEASARCLSTNMWHLIATIRRDILIERDSDLKKSGRFIICVNCLYLLCVHLCIAAVMSL